jgi:hypothetical protein
MDRYRPAAGGCVHLQIGDGKWAMCLLPTRAPDPGRVIESLAEVPEQPGALVVLNWWDDGYFPTAAAAEKLGLNDDRVFLLDATAPADRSDKWHTQRVLSNPVRMDGPLELGTLRLERVSHAPHALLARWSDSDRTLLLGAKLPLDAWTRALRPRHLVGTLEPPETPAEQRALEKKVEAQLFDDVRTLDLLFDVVGHAQGPFLSQMQPWLEAKNVRVRTFAAPTMSPYR